MPSKKPKEDESGIESDDTPPKKTTTKKISPSKINKIKPTSKGNAAENETRSSSLDGTVDLLLDVGTETEAFREQGGAQSEGSPDKQSSECPNCFLICVCENKKETGEYEALLLADATKKTSTTPKKINGKLQCNSSKQENVTVVENIATTGPSLGDKALYQNSEANAPIIEGSEPIKAAISVVDKEIVTDTLVKSCPETEVGIKICGYHPNIMITNINPPGLRRNTPLKAGMALASINGANFPSSGEAVRFLKMISGTVTIMAKMMPHHNAGDTENWACQTCTYLNHHWNACCEVCGYPVLAKVTLLQDASDYELMIDASETSAEQYNQADVLTSSMPSAAESSVPSPAESAAPSQAEPVVVPLKSSRKCIADVLDRKWYVWTLHGQSYMGIGWGVNPVLQTSVDELCKFRIVPIDGNSSLSKSQSGIRVALRNERHGFLSCRRKSAVSSSCLAEFRGEAKEFETFTMHYNAMDNSFLFQSHNHYFLHYNETLHSVAFKACSARSPADGLPVKGRWELLNSNEINRVGKKSAQTTIPKTIARTALKIDTFGMLSY